MGAAFLMSGTLLASGCSSPHRDFRGAPDVGSAGEAGSSGAAGAAPAAGDGGEAGGIDSSNAGAPPVEPAHCAKPCPNADPADCDVTCVVKDGTASCVTKAKDNDNDGHPTAACLAMPGDDCDDGNAAVHPGVKEICDGIDNDCNGKSDLDDGLALSGAAKTLAGVPSAQPSVAWAPDRSVYGVAYLSGNPQQVAFSTFNSDGNLLNGPNVVSTGTLADEASEIAWGGDAFGIAWSSAYTVTFRTITSDGALGTAIPAITAPSGLLAFNPHVARAASGDWTLLYTVGDSNGPQYLAGKTLLAPVNPTVQGTTIVQPAPSHPSLVALGGSFLLGYDSDASAMVSAISSNLQTMNARPYQGSQPVVGSGPNGYAVALGPGSSADSPSFYLYSGTGTAQCGPAKLGAMGMRPTSVVAAPNGYLVTLQGSGGGLVVQEIRADCSLGYLFAADATGGSNAHIAGGTTGYAVVWDGSGGGQIRNFGLHFCD